MKNMLLKDFVEQSIKEIFAGLASASKEISPSIGIIAPTVTNHYEGKKHNLDYDIQDVEFDIAVTASEEADGEIRAGISVLSSGAEFSKENVHAQRIKFTIPIGIKKGTDRSYSDQLKEYEDSNKTINYPTRNQGFYET